MGCPDLCLCGFDNLLGRRGIEVDGAGTPDDPFFTQPATGYTIPSAMTAAERAALPAPADTEIGWTVYETDTGRTVIWTGADVFGWQLQTAYGIEHAPGTVAISAAVGDWQDVCTLDMEQGAWAIWAKANVEASVEPNPVTWSFRLNDTATNTDLDLAACSGVFEDAATPTTSILRPVALMDLVTFQETHTVVFSVGRSSTEGSQLLAHPKMMAIRLPLPFA